MNRNVKGNIQFYFMTNYEKDIKREIGLDANLSQSFLLQQFETGRYLIKLDWTDGEKSYYQEIDTHL